MAIDDAGLVVRARAGEREAFARLVARHYPLVLALCRRMVGPLQAEDAAQEAVLAAMLNLDRLRRPERFGPWLGGIGLNLCRLWLRDQARRPPSLAPEARRSKPESAARSNPWLVDDGLDPAELAASAEVATRVRAAVAALAPGQRAAVWLYYLAGLTQAEVAETPASSRARCGCGCTPPGARCASRSRRCGRRRRWRRRPTPHPSR